MEQAAVLRKKLELPEISQIGIVVRDMGKAVEYYEGISGLGPLPCMTVHRTSTGSGGSRRT